MDFVLTSILLNERVCMYVLKYLKKNSKKYSIKTHTDVSVMTQSRNFSLQLFFLNRRLYYDIYVITVPLRINFQNLKTVQLLITVYHTKKGKEKVWLSLYWGQGQVTLIDLLLVYHTAKFPK